MMTLPLLLSLWNLPNPVVLYWSQQLNHDDYQIRECATEYLESKASFYLSRRLRYSKDPEVRLRAWYIYNHRRNEVLESLEPYPCLDSLTYSMKHHEFDKKCALYCYLNTHYIEKCPWQEEAVYSLRRNNRYRQATQLWASDMLDHGVPVAALKLLFKELHRRDDDYISSRYYRKP